MPGASLHFLCFVIVFEVSPVCMSLNSVQLNGSCMSITVDGGFPWL